MTPAEWLTSSEPDLMLEHIERKVTRAQLVKFVRQCWSRVTSYLPDVPTEFTVVDQFSALADQLSNHDAVLYASEAALKAAGLAADMKAEQRAQADVLRHIMRDEFR